MATAADLGLGPNDLAFVFDSNVGVNAADLGAFLQRASVVSRRAGADLYVVGLHEGSLAVVAKAVRRGAKALGNAVADEFQATPVKTTAGALAAVVSTAIITAMIPQPGKVSPVAKAGAALVENHNVSQISLLTVNQTTLIMDESRAAEVREFDHAAMSDRPLLPDVRRLISRASEGNLSGTVTLVEGELHFRPDGFRYLVPIDYLVRPPAAVQPGRHLIVSGEIVLRDSLPDSLVIHDAYEG